MMWMRPTSYPHSSFVLSAVITVGRRHLLLLGVRRWNILLVTRRRRKDRSPFDKRLVAPSNQDCAKETERPARLMAALALGVIFSPLLQLDTHTGGSVTVCKLNS